MFTWENNFGGEESSPATYFDVDSIGLTLYKTGDSPTDAPIGFLPTGSFSNFQEVVDAPDLAGAWEEGFQAGRHTSESNKNPYKA